jgi:putative ABC transport system permease protein
LSRIGQLKDVEVKFVESFFMAIRSLAANKLRSSLTMLGVIIGVGSVITLMSVGRGAEASITSTLQDMGTNLVYITSQTPGVQGLAAMQSAAPSLTLADAEAIADQVPDVITVAPITEGYVEVVYSDTSVVAVVEATTPDFEQVLNYPAAEGQFITERNVAARDMVVVIGDKVAKDLFGENSPLEKKVKISGRQFTVIGVLEAKGGQMMGVSMDSIIVLPITTYQSRLFPRQTSRGEEAVQQIAVQVASVEVTDIVSADITDLLRRRHNIKGEGKDDFLIMSQEQMLSMVQQITGIFTLVLGAIASISLLVGSIGIMNIMLVSVTERTREIGIRKAVGAKRRDILLQFLQEAAMLSLSGGAIGIIGGWLLSVVISRIDAGGITLHALVSPDIVILAISVSVFIGLVSGIYPAMRASRLNPIDALHYE